MLHGTVNVFNQESTYTAISPTMESENVCECLTFLAMQDTAKEVHFFFVPLRILRRTT